MVMSDSKIRSIRKDPESQNWIYITNSLYGFISEDFIIEFQDYIIWNNIGIDNKLSEDFIIRFKDRLNWRIISQYQNLSKDFIMKYIDYIKIDDLIVNENISPEIKEFCKMFI